MVSTRLQQGDESSKRGKGWCLGWLHREELDCSVWLKEGQEGFSEEVTFDPRQVLVGEDFRWGEEHTQRPGG